MPKLKLKKKEIEKYCYNITTMSTTSSTYYNDLSDFLTKHNAKNIQNSAAEKEITHTRIPSQE